MTVQTSFLDAILKIPGDTPGEKYKEIAQLVSRTLSNGQSVSTLIENHQVPGLLGPYCNVEAARILNNHQMVIDALKSDDSLVIQKALSIESFFNGSNGEVTNPDYFLKHLIPHVSLNTRAKIIKALSYQLQKPQLAEEFFTMFHSMYGIEQATPLLLACSPEFTHKTSIEKNIVLNCRMIKLLYKKDPKLVIRYIKDARKREILKTRNVLKLNLIDYGNIIVKFIKVDIESFIEIVESYEGDGGEVSNKLNLTFSKNLGRLFVKIGLKYLLNNPKLYIEMLPIQSVDRETMRLIFPKLLPEESERKILSYTFTEKYLKYLEKFSKKEKLMLLEKSYATRYNRKLLDDTDMMSSELMLLLPDKERFKQAKIMMDKKALQKNHDTSHYPSSWRCYLKPSEGIPSIKDDIANASQIEERCDLISELIYCCKVNNDSEMLHDVLKYFNERHKNERAEMFLHLMEMLDEIYGDDLYSLTDEHWTLIDCIIRRMHVKGYMSSRKRFLFKVLEVSTFHKLSLELLPAAEENLALMAEINLKRYNQCWNILIKNPVFEEKCLTYFINYASQKIEDQSPSNKDWHGREEDIVHRIIKAIYDYNNRLKKSQRNIAKKFISVGDYSLLMEIVKRLLNNEEYKNYTAICEIKRILKNNDYCLFECIVKDRDDIAEVESGDAFHLLKRDPKVIFKHWREYLSQCKSWSTSKNVIRFVKTVRWHNEIAIKWREECEKCFVKEHLYLGILGILLDGPSFVQFVSPYMPQQSTLQTDGSTARNEYLITSIIPSVCNLTNPPPPLSIIGQFFEGDYLSDGLRASTNLCRRTAVSKVTIFITSLMSQRISVKKHTLRLHFMVATIDDSCQLLSTEWQTNTHYSIRDLQFQKIYDLFLNHPTNETYNLLMKSLNSLSSNVQDWKLLILLAKFDRVPNEYLEEYLNKIFDVIDKMKDIKVALAEVENYLQSMLSSIDSSVCDILGQHFCMRIIKKYLFHENRHVGLSALQLAIDSFLLSRKDLSEARMILFVEMISEDIRLHWDEPCPQKPHYFPVNYIFHEFVKQFCNDYKRISLKLVELLQGIFENTLQPKRDMTSYLYLICTREQLLSNSPKNFGVRMGCEIKRLTKEFSQLIVHPLSEVMEHFLGQFTISSDAWTLFIEGLLEEKDINNDYMAAYLFQHFSCKVQDLDAFRSLLNCEYPIVASIIRQKMNSDAVYCYCESN